MANAVTAFSTSYPLTMAARFLAGLVTGLLWALLAGYARGIVAPERRGRAMAVAMVGTPVALSVGGTGGDALGPTDRLAFHVRADECARPDAGRLDSAGASGLAGAERACPDHAGRQGAESRAWLPSYW
ncbi:MFS transporter [Streptomyces sp. NPDC056178]|uniref:MFS transporter n=1 Tax=unclassified Streptomyces TaxID=2593676 RepID=UPI0035DD34D4